MSTRHTTGATTTAQPTKPAKRPNRSQRRAHMPPPKTTTPACTANQCHQGRSACPCPQACETAEPAMPPLAEKPATAKELAAALAIALAAACAVIAIVANLAPSA